MAAQAKVFQARPLKPCRYKYDVFLSFRGKDTHKNFTDHLYMALVRAGIHTFRDDDEITRGESILNEIQNALESSKVAIVVFSKDYGFSRWCLDELVTIMEQRSSSGLIVMPLFYDVDPSQVRNQTGNYALAFSGHEEQNKEDRARVLRWRAALREVADLAGMFLQSRHEALFIQEIVQDIANRLNCKALHVSPYAIGVDHHVAKLNSWLQDQSSDVKINIIYGIGGVGKTTIAKIVYNENYKMFQGSSFLANISRRTSEEPAGMLALQRQLLSDLLKVKTNKIYNEDEGTVKIKDAICCKRVLLVLDDVDELEQFNAILGNRKWMSPGSKMMVTTRRSRLVHDQEDCRMLEVGVLNDNQSLQLLSLHAFGQSHPPAEYIEQIRRAANYCGGLPLAVQVLGSSLFGNPVDVWESALQEMREIPHPTVQKILRMSYNSLQNDRHQNLFLDVACFFVGMDKDYVVAIVDGCGYTSRAGIQHLIDRCLITIDGQNKITMHQLIRDMGREIVREESLDDPEKRSRLWNHNDAILVLSENKGAESIKGLKLNCAMLRQSKHMRTLSTVKLGKRDSSGNCNELSYRVHCAKRCRVGWFSWKPYTGAQPSWCPPSDKIELRTKAFARMQKLKLLQLQNVELKGGYKDFPRSLAWLYWHGFSLDRIPNELLLENVGVLDIQYSSLKQLWKGTRWLPKLKILNLSHSRSLLATPDFSGLPNLERLILKDCLNLVKIDESIGVLKRILSLNLKNCKKLKELPGTISKLESLEELDLSGCSQLDMLPMEGLRSRVTVVDGIAMEGMNSTRKAKRNVSLCSILRSWFPPRKSLQFPRFSFSFLPPFLVRLDLVNCNLSDVHIPSDLTFLPALQHLDLSFNPIHTLPESIHSLKLLSLWLTHCQRLQSLPPLPQSLDLLFLKGCTSLERIAYLPGFSARTGCYRYGCGNLVEIGGVFKLHQVTDLDIEMINRLSMGNVESIGDTEVEMVSTLSGSSKPTLPQVLHEFGIFTFFLSGSEIPDWYLSAKGDSLSFLVPHVQSSNIIGLNFCAVYVLDDSSFLVPRVQSSNNDIFPMVRIENRTKSSAWNYSPTFYEVPRVSEDKLWYSHMSFGNQLEIGDQVSVTVASRFRFRVKKFGIHVVHEDENHHESGQSITSSPWYSLLTEVDVSAYKIVPSVTNFLVDAYLSSFQMVPSFTTATWYQILSDVGFSSHHNVPERFYFFSHMILERLKAWRWLLIHQKQDEENSSAEPMNLLPEIQGILGSVDENKIWEVLELVVGPLKKFPFTSWGES